MFLFALTAAALAGSDIAVCYSSGYQSDVLTKLKATKLFSKITEYNCGSTTPTVADFQKHESVLVYSDSGFANQTLLGDRLADYVDSGGGVVEAVFANGSVALKGRFESGGYEPITGSTQNQGTVLTSVIDCPTCEVMQGVTFLNGGSSSYHTSDAALGAGATLLAHWNNGLPLVAQMDHHAGTTIGLNFYPPSSTIRGDFWENATDGEWILGNSLDVAMGAPSGSLGALTLNVFGVCPGATTIEVTGGSPNGSVSIYSGATVGVDAIDNGACAGTVSGLDVATRRKTVNLDGSGNAVMTPTFSAVPCGMALQVVDRDTCTASNVSFIP